MISMHPVSFRRVVGAVLAVAIVLASPTRADVPDDAPARTPLARPAAAAAEPRPTAEPLGATSTLVATYDQIGGDDVIVTTHPDMTTSGSYALDVDDATGDLYAAVVVDADPGAPLDQEIRVYRSTDGGLHWASYGTLGGAAVGVQYRNATLHVGEGTVDNVYVAYVYADPTANATIRVAYKPLASPAAVWTEVTALAAAGVNFQSPSLHSSESSEANYRLFLAATGSDGNGDDVWVTRSTTFGVSWVAGYEIASLATPDRRYAAPVIRYGRGGVVHCTYSFLPEASTGLDQAVRYRRALNFMGASTDWQPIVSVTSNLDGVDQYASDVAASPISGNALLTWQRIDAATSARLTATVRPSTDDGATWPAANEIALPTYLPHALACDASGNFVLLGHGSGFGDYGIARSAAATPRDFGPIEVAADRSYAQGTFTYYADAALALDPTRGQRAAMLYPHADPGIADTLFFDAEWLRDPGRPNVAPGFPLPLPSTATSAPAIVELDGDPQREIAYTSALGEVVVRNHDGSLVPGWPVDIQVSGTDMPVAVGDLDGDGHDEVVAGTAGGLVYAFRGDGTLLPGFPYSMGVAAKAWVSLGRFDDARFLQIVATCATRIRRIGANGVQIGGTLNTVSTIAGPAAIGDVDHDGDREIVVLQDGFMDVFTPAGAVQAFRSLPAKTFSAPPALADLDLDGDLEIIAATDQGDVYVMRPDGSDLPGWPSTLSTGEILNSPVAANTRSTGEPEVFWTERGPATPRLQGRTWQNAVMSGFPVTHTDGWLTYASPVVDFNVGSADLFLAGRDSQVWSWDNFGTPNPGWPKALNSQIQLPVATGDVNEDGQLDVVVLGSSMTVLETHATNERQSPRSVWPMYGYDPQRQFCLACDVVDQVTGAGPAVAPVALSLRVEGNPGRNFGFAFALPSAGPARLEVYDVTGRRVASVFKSERGAGEQRAAWNGRDDRGERAQAGVYYARLQGVINGARAEVVRRLTLLP